MSLKEPDLDQRFKQIYERVMSLPSYGLIAGRRDNPMISRKDVVKLLLRWKPPQPTAEELGEGFC
jgi:hypothetical protein